jgi:DNA invertase Pin-like site-specific DNA recombinase
MINHAELNKFDLIITKEISRFARNTLDSIYYTRHLKKHGIGVVFLNDNINTLEPDAELRLTIMSSIAQEESRRISERVKWGQKRRMEQGVVFGRSMLGYDVCGGKMYINEKGAKIVRLIFRKFVYEGKGTHVIARELREEGIRPMRVGEWQNSVILKVLQNEKYCGDLVQKKTYTPDFLSHDKKYNRGQEDFVILKNHHEPIITRKLFEEANRILKSRSLMPAGKPKFSNRYPFSGKIQCGCCGASYVARSKTRKDGSKYHSWRCREAVRYGAPRRNAEGMTLGCMGAGIRNEDVIHIMYLICQSLTYDKAKIKDSLIPIIHSVLSEDTDNRSVDKLMRRLMAIEKKKEKLIELYTSEAISQAEFDDIRMKYRDEINHTQLEIDHINRMNRQIDKQCDSQYTTEKIIDEILSGMEYEDEFCKQILDKIIVKDKNRIEVTLRELCFKWQFEIR